MTPRSDPSLTQRSNLCCVLLSLVILSACNNALPVLTQHNDAKRSGSQTETILNPTNVHTGAFGKIFTRVLPSTPNSSGQLKDRIYTQPLIVTSASTTKVIVATDTNMVYAFDADHPSAGAPLWKVNLGLPESAIDNWPDPHCNRTLPVIGVLGTPVITPDQKSLYVVSKNRTGPASSTTVSFTVHKIDVATGNVVAKIPVAQNVSAFNPYAQLQRSGLVWVDNAVAPGGGYVYAAFGGHCDVQTTPPYHGWIFGFDGNLQQQVAAFNATPDAGGWGGGIWQAGQAPVYTNVTCIDCEPSNLFVSTGNGSGKLTNSVLKLHVQPDGSLMPWDYFIPYNQAALNNCDADVAATGPLFLGNDGPLVVGGKEGVVYVLRSALLGHPVATDTPSNLAGTQSGNFCQHTNGGGGFNTQYIWNPNGDFVDQEFEAASPATVQRPSGPETLYGHIHGAPVYTTLSDGLWRLYVWPEMDNLKQFKQQNSTKFFTAPEHQSAVQMFAGMPGGMLSISTGGANPIVWATHPKINGWDPPQADPSATTVPAQSIPAPVPGILFAFDGTDVSKNLWSSDTQPQDRLGEFSKFTAPTISNGRVYVATFSGELQVYGLCTTQTPCK